MLKRLRDPNARCWARYYTLPNGLWGFTIREMETDTFVANRLGLKSYEDAVEFASRFYNVE